MPTRALPCPSPKPQTPLPHTRPTSPHPDTLLNNTPPHRSHTRCRYTDAQQFDTEFIEIVRNALLRFIERQGEATLTAITNWITDSGLVKNVGGAGCMGFPEWVEGCCRAATFLVFLLGLVS